MLLVMCPQNSLLSKNGSIYLGEKADILIVRLIDYISTYAGKKIFFREKHAMEDSFFSSDKTHSIATTVDFNVPEILKGLATSFIDKTRYSGFYNTELEIFLKRDKVTNITLVGVETHTSILFTAEELRNRGYSVTVIEPCCMSRDDYMHSYSISLMRNFLGVRISL